MSLYALTVTGPVASFHISQDHSIAGHRFMVPHVRNVRFFHSCEQGGDIRVKHLLESIYWWCIERLVSMGELNESLL